MVITANLFDIVEVIVFIMGIIILFCIYLWNNRK